MDRTVNVYFVRGVDSGLIKIGATYHIPTRLQGVAHKFEPVELFASVRASARLEYELHGRFLSLRHDARGLEWFRDGAAIQRVVEAIPSTQRGSVVFVWPGDRRRGKYPLGNRLLFPTLGLRGHVDALAVAA